MARHLDKIGCEQEGESKWQGIGRPYTQEEKDLIVSKVIQIGIETCMGNHVYCFKGELYRQAEGGAIGVRLTGEVSRVVMDRWADRVS